MEEDFGIPSSDTIPITNHNNKGDEGKPLQLEKNEKNSDGAEPFQHNEASARYRNLESETSDGGDAPKINSIHLDIDNRNKVPQPMGNNHMTPQLATQTSAVYNPRFASPGSDSVWSIPSSSASTAAHSIKWYRHPKVREHWKVVVASFVLFFIGLCLCLTGIILEAIQVETGGIFMLFVIGAFCFIPGVYHVIAVYYAVHGKRGFSFYNLPLFN